MYIYGFTLNRVSVRHVAALRDDDTTRVQLMLVYGAFVALVVITMLVRTLSFIHMCVRASRNLHRRMYAGLTGTAVWFFKTNATGRILNRFARDMDNIDSNLPLAFNGVLTVRTKMRC